MGEAAIEAAARATRREPSTAAEKPTDPGRRESAVGICHRARSQLARRFGDGAVTSVDAIAARERCSVRKVNMTISLAFLAPDLVKAAIEGRLPRGTGMVRLCELPIEWSGQYRTLGLFRPLVPKSRTEAPFIRSPFPRKRDLVPETPEPKAGR